MGLRFQRRFRIIPGLRVNLSKSGASLSIGHRGAWFTISPRGRRISVGLPSTGLWWTESHPWAYRQPIPPGPPIRGHHRVAFVLIVIASAAITSAVINAIVGPPL
jgi:hypothetical protein